MFGTEHKFDAHAREAPPSTSTTQGLPGISEGTLFAAGNSNAYVHMHELASASAMPLPSSTSSAVASGPGTHGHAPALLSAAVSSSSSRKRSRGPRKDCGLGMLVHQGMVAPGMTLSLYGYTCCVCQEPGMVEFEEDGETKISEGRTWAGDVWSRVTGGPAHSLALHKAEVKLHDGQTVSVKQLFRPRVQPEADSDPDGVRVPQPSPKHARKRTTKPLSAAAPPSAAVLAANCTRLEIAPSMTAPLAAAAVPSVAALLVAAPVPSVAAPLAAAAVLSVAAPLAAAPAPSVAAPLAAAAVPSVAAPLAAAPAPSVAAPLAAAAVPSVAAPLAAAPAPSVAAPLAAAAVPSVAALLAAARMPSVDAPLVAARAPSVAAPLMGTPPTGAGEGSSPTDAPARGEDTAAPWSYEEGPETKEAEKDQKQNPEGLPVEVVVKDLAFLKSKISDMGVEERVAACALNVRAARLAGGPTAVACIDDIYKAIGCRPDAVRGSLFAVLAASLLCVTTPPSFPPPPLPPNPLHPSLPPPPFPLHPPLFPRSSPSLPTAPPPPPPLLPLPPLPPSTLEGELRAAIATDLWAQTALKFVEHPVLPSLVELAWQAFAILGETTELADSTDRELAVARAFKLVMDRAEPEPELESFADAVALAVLAERFPDVSISILSLHERENRVTKSQYGSPTAAGCPPQVVLTLALRIEEAGGGRRRVYELLWPLPCAPALRIINAGAVIHVPNLINFEWELRENETELKDPQYPGEAILFSRLNKQKGTFELRRRFNGTFSEELVWEHPAEYEDKLVRAEGPAVPEAQLLALLDRLGLRNAGLADAVDVACITIDIGADSLRDHSELEVKELGTQVQELINDKTIDEIALQQNCFAGWTRAGKSTCLSGLICDGLPKPADFALLASLIAAVAALPADPDGSPDRFGCSPAPSMPVRPMDQVQRLREILGAPQDELAKRIRHLLNALEARAGNEKGIFVSGRILPSRTVNATSSVPIVTLGSPFFYVLVTFKDRKERDDAKAAGLAALEQIRDLDREDSEARIGMQERAAIALALAMAGNESLTPATLDDVDRLTPEHFELPRELMLFEELLGKTVLYHSACTDREEAKRGVGRVLTLLTANVNGGCWGLVRSVEMGVPSAHCVGLRQVDSVGSTETDAARREAARAVQPVDMLVHVDSGGDTPLAVFASLQEPLGDLVARPEEHAVLIACDPRRELGDGDVDVQSIRSAMKSRRLSALQEWASQLPASQWGSAARKRLFFGTYNAGPKYFKTLAVEGHEAAQAMPVTARPDYAEIMALLRGQGCKIVLQRLREKAYAPAHAVLTRGLLLYENTLKLPSLGAAADRKKLQEMLQGAFRALQRQLSKVQTLERGGHSVMASVDKEFGKEFGEFWDKACRDAETDFLSSTVQGLLKNRFGNDAVGSVGRDVDQKSLEHSVLFGLSFKRFIEEIKCIGPVFQRILNSSVFPRWKQALIDQCSPVLPALHQHVHSLDLQSMAVEAAYTNIVSTSNPRLQAAVDKVFKNVVRDAWAFIKNDLLIAVLDEFHYELANVVDSAAAARAKRKGRNRRRRAASAAVLEALSNAPASSKRRKQVCPCSEVCLEDILEVLKTDDTYKTIVERVSKKAIVHAHAWLTDFRKQLPARYRQVIRQELKDLKDASKAADLARERGAAELEELRRQCESVRAELASIEEAAAAAGL
eukprot:tig00000144_g9056.t1